MSFTFIQPYFGLSNSLQTGQASSAVSFGTTWTASGSLTTGRYIGDGNGTTDSCVAVGGWISSGPATTTNCEEFSGSTWAAGGNLAVAVRYHGCFGASLNSVVSCGGHGDLTTSEEYNGTSWSGGGPL